MGPATKEQKADCDWFVEGRQNFEDELKNLQEFRAEAEENWLTNQIKEGIGQLRSLLQVVNARLP